MLKVESGSARVAVVALECRERAGSEWAELVEERDDGGLAAAEEEWELGGDAEEERELGGESAVAGGELAVGEAAAEGGGEPGGESMGRSSGSGST